MARFTKTEKTRNANVFRAYGLVCACCGSYAWPASNGDDDVLLAARLANLQIDHVVPRSRGGDDSMDNLQVICHFCNHTKGSAQGVPRQTPRAPADWQTVLQNRMQWLLHIADGIADGTYSRIAG